MADQGDSRPSKASAFDLRIDELVLRGVRATDRYAFVDAFERELVRLFHDSGAPLPLLDAAGTGAARSVRRIDAGSFVVPHGASPTIMGKEAARALHRGLANARGSAAAQTAQRPAQPPRGSAR